MVFGIHVENLLKVLLINKTCIFDNFVFTNKAHNATNKVNNK